jgi:hypothetical protein
LQLHAIFATHKLTMDITKCVEILQQRSQAQIQQEEDGRGCSACRAALTASLENLAISSQESTNQFPSSLKDLTDIEILNLFTVLQGERVQVRMSFYRIGATGGLTCDCDFTNISEYLYLLFSMHITRLIVTIIKRWRRCVRKTGYQNIPCCARRPRRGLQRSANASYQSR